MHPRLHVLLARNARTEVVLRRGPTNSVACIGWNRDDDRFSLGQWFKGRIYEHRADVSPDGRHFIYFALNGKRGSWTAVSRAPWLHAIAFFRMGGAWAGGGQFVDDRTYWVDDFGRHHDIVETPTLTRVARAPNATWNGHLGIYLARLERDGWTRIDSGKYERALRNGWTLQKVLEEGVGRPFVERHVLFHERGPVQRDWEWADVDGDRLVFAHRGCLWSAPLEAPDEPAVCLHDFGPMRFEAIQAPYSE